MICNILSLKPFKMSDLPMCNRSSGSPGISSANGDNVKNKPEMSHMRVAGLDPEGSQNIGTSDVNQLSTSSSRNSGRNPAARRGTLAWVVCDAVGKHVTD
jgi:hypothetical protein